MHSHDGVRWKTAAGVPAGALGWVKLFGCKGFYCASSLFLGVKVSRIDIKVKMSHFRTPSAGLYALQVRKRGAFHQRLSDANAIEACNA